MFIGEMPLIQRVLNSKVLLVDVLKGMYVCMLSNCDCDTGKCRWAYIVNY